MVKSSQLWSNPFHWLPIRIAGGILSVPHRPVWTKISWSHSTTSIAHCRLLVTALESSLVYLLFLSFVPLFILHIEFASSVIGSVIYIVKVNMSYTQMGWLVIKQRWTNGQESRPCSSAIPFWIKKSMLEQYLAHCTYGGEEAQLQSMLAKLKISIIIRTVSHGEHIGIIRNDYTLIMDVYKGLFPALIMKLLPCASDHKNLIYLSTRSIHWIISYAANLKSV